MDRILDIRFLAPVGIMIFFIFFFSPSSFINYTKELSDFNLLVGTVGILGIGFMISSITERWIRFRNLQLPDYDYKFEILGIKDPKHKMDASELASWIVLNEEADRYKNDKGHLPSQIHKRWNMAMANYNAFLGTFLGFVIALLLVGTQHLTKPGSYWLALYMIIWIFFILVFWRNGRVARLSVLRMDSLLAIRNNK